MSQSDFIPRADAEFDKFFKGIIQYVNTKCSGTTPAWTHIPKTEREAISDVYGQWHTAYAATLSPHLPQITREKNRVRLVAERSLRAFINRFLRWPPVTDEDRDTMGIPNHDHIRTPQPIPTTIPEIETDTRVIRQISLRLRNHGAVHWGKPDHIHGMELAWGIRDDSPGQISDLPHFENETSNPITLDFEEEERGKRIFFAARWVNNTAQPGPWSELLSAIVP
jgi:hypothetical protein